MNKENKQLKENNMATPTTPAPQVTKQDVAPAGVQLKVQTDAPAPQQFLNPSGQFNTYECSNPKCKKQNVIASKADELNFKCCDGDKPVKQNRVK